MTKLSQNFLRLRVSKVVKRGHEAFLIFIPFKLETSTQNIRGGANMCKFKVVGPPWWQPLKMRPDQVFQPSHFTFETKMLGSASRAYVAAVTVTNRCLDQTWARSEAIPKHLIFPWGSMPPDPTRWCMLIIHHHVHGRISLIKLPLALEHSYQEKFSTTKACSEA